MNEKKCAVCSKTKPASEFYKDNRMKSGLTSECKQCRRDRNKQWHEGNYKPNPRAKRYRKPDGHLTESDGYRRNAHLKRRYGISQDDYEKMYAEQGGCCSICKKHHKTLFVDHCHSSNIVRGLLCSRCNFGLGNFLDSIPNLENAIEYLKKVGQI